MRIAFNFCKHAMATRFADFLKDELPCLFEGKKRGKHKKEAK